MKEVGVRVPLRFWVEIGFASASGCLAVAIARFPDWIEVAFRRDPDGDSGSFEGLIATAFSVVAAALFAMAALEWFRASGGASMRGLGPAAGDESP